MKSNNKECLNGNGEQTQLDSCVKSDNCRGRYGSHEPSQGVVLLGVKYTDYLTNSTLGGSPIHSSLSREVVAHG